MTRSLRTKLAALTAIGGLATAAAAQPPAQPLPDQKPRVIRWNGGYMVMDNAGGVVVRQAGVPGGSSTNIINGSGNGIGNRIVVDNGDTSGVTIVSNSRLGIGNKIIVNAEDVLLDIPDLPLDLLGLPAPKPAPKVAPADPVVIPPAIDPQPQAEPVVTEPEPLLYRGKENNFWTKKTFCEGNDCNLYWSPKDKAWFRYSKDDDTYRPVTDGPPAPQD